MEIYSIGLATDCKLDDDFFDLIEQAALLRGLTTYRIYPSNLDETIFRLKDNKIRFSIFYDRASDTSSQFLRLYSALIEHQILYFVDLNRQKTVSDKAVMHEDFIKNKINVPNTIILPEYLQNQSIGLIDSDLDFLGRPFVIKPSVHTGAGSGVFLNSYTLSEVEDKRKEFPHDKYLLQEKINPKEIYLKRFWFRSFYVCGKIITTWWDDFKHRYEPLSENDLEKIDITPINEMMMKIHDVCELNFFSTELAITENNILYAIDYVNEICDMRLQSKHKDGIPDDIVNTIAEEIIKHIEKSLP